MRKSVGSLRSECLLLTNALEARPSTHFSGYRGGLNGSTQRSAQTQVVLKTKAKITRYG